MKRDFDLIRRLILGLNGNPKTPGDPVDEHLRLLGESGLVQLTDEGREFVSLIADDALWHEALYRFKSQGLGVPYSLLVEVLRDLHAQPLYRFRNGDTSVIAANHDEAIAKVAKLLPHLATGFRFLSVEEIRVQDSK